jgi:threonine aldolase
MFIFMKRRCFVFGVSLLIDGKRGMITAEQVAGAINDPEFYHNPLTSLAGRKHY